MKKIFLILIILLISVLIRLYYLLQIDPVINISSFSLNIVSIVLFWLFINTIFKQRTLIHLFSTLFLSISPWHIFLSKEGFAVNLMLIIVLIIMTLLIKYLYQNSIIFFVSISICILFILFPSNFMQTTYRSIFQNPQLVWLTDEQIREHGSSSLILRVSHNKLTNYINVVFNNYSNHFSFQTLFLDGDLYQKNRISEMGLMYLFDSILISLGLVYIIKTSNDYKPIIIWLLIAPIPTALSNNLQISLTSYSMVIPLIIISGVGFYFCFAWISKRIKQPCLRYLVFFIIFLLISWDVSRFLHQIYYHAIK
ncbi:hypothetical protein HYW41_01570 [Candidatus Daviesbacteria bacterium]|nr:hypothetical protein [Candidatus Daviesbacteria bacterium]